MRKPKKTRAEQKEDTRERVREAALALFTQTGYAKTTTKAVAEAAGVAAGTVFVHARDKEDLLFLVMHERLSEIADRQLASVPKRKPLVERIVHVYRGFFAMYAEQPELGIAFIKALPGATGPNGQAVTAMTFGFLHRIAMLAKTAQDRGEIDAHADLELFAQSTFALYVFALSSWSTGVMPASLLEGWFSAALTQYVRGLSPR